MAYNFLCPCSSMPEAETVTEWYLLCCKWTHSCQVDVLCASNKLLLIVWCTFLLRLWQQKWKSTISCERPRPVSKFGDWFCSMIVSTWFARTPPRSTCCTPWPYHQGRACQWLVWRIPAAWPAVPYRKLFISLHTEGKKFWRSALQLQVLWSVYNVITGWRKKTGPPYLIANILKISWPNCVEIGELQQYYMLNTVINFLFKNFIAL